MAAVKTFKPSGILDGIHGNELRKEIIAAVEAGANTVLVDLKEITFMDSAGLAALLKTIKTIKASGVQLFLCSINEQVKMLFDLTKMGSVFNILVDETEFNSVILSAK